jgi:hypothetical protein
VVNIDNGFGAAMAALRILAVVKQSRAQAAVVNAVAVEEAEPSPALA